MNATNESDTRRTIMEATYRALCDHGYASLTMQDIAAEAGTSTSLLHYHFDTKQELLVAFIDHLQAEFAATVETIDDDPPDQRLREFIDWFVVAPPEDDRAAFHVAFLELRSQAPFTEAYREGLRHSDDLIRGTLETIIEDGIEEGVFRADADSEAIARLIFATMDGARVRQVTLGEDEYVAVVRDALYDHVIDDLLVEGAE